jgi:transposase
VRVTTAFKRLLRLPGASVVDVSFTADAVIVIVRLRRRRRVCSACGQTGRRLEIHDRRVKRWRHLDLGASRCVIECELRLLRCHACGVRMEPVPWARPGAQHTRDLSVEAPHVKRTGGGGRLVAASWGRPEPGSRWSAPPDERP